MLGYLRAECSENFWLFEHSKLFEIDFTVAAAGKNKMSSQDGAGFF